MFSGCLRLDVDEMIGRVWCILDEMIGRVWCILDEMIGRIWCILDEMIGRIWCIVDEMIGRIWCIKKIMIVCWFQNMIRLHLFLFNLYVFIRGVFHHSRVLFIVGGIRRVAIGRVVWPHACVLIWEKGHYYDF